MNSTPSVIQASVESSVEFTLDSLFESVASELNLTRQLYKETILQTAEHQYIHELLSGKCEAFMPESYRVEVVEQITRYLLQSEGKWIRAVLVLLVADACGKRGASVHQIGVAVELIHLATLIHDDIIDEAPMRRGINSVSSGWGNSIAVLLGDFFFSKAFKLLLASESVSSQKLLTHATGQMCLGEIRQLRFGQDSNRDEKDYLQTIENKTASLMASASASGAHLAEQNDVVVEAFHAYGHNLGMAFQIADDVLDYTSSTITLGKERGVDLKNGKTTLPLMHLLETDETQTKAILNNDATIEEQTEALLALMKKSGSVEYAINVGKRYGEAAKQNLKTIQSEVGKSESLNTLHKLVDFVLTRKR